MKIYTVRKEKPTDNRVMFSHVIPVVLCVFLVVLSISAFLLGETLDILVMK